MSRIDCAFINSAWLNIMASFRVQFLLENISDHCPLKLTPYSAQRKNKDAFKFCNVWSSHPDFLEVVKEGWTQSIQGCSMFQVMKKMKLLNVKFKSFSRRYFSDIVAREDEDRLALAKIQSELHRNPLDTRIQQVENDLFQRFKRSSDLAKFFSRMVTDQQEIADVFVEYYQVLLGTKGGNRIAAFQSFMKNGHTLTTSQQLKLVRQYTAAEVKKQYLALRKLRVQVISKRLKEALYALVADNQAAFIEGRSLLHNVLIYHDLLRYYNRKTTPRCLVKIDLKKAYDMVSWDFSEEILRCYGFLIPFIKLIMVGVTSTSFTIKVNGEGYGYFKGKRGLRQGDRMSLLFVLVMEYLSRVLRQMGDLPDFQYHPMYKSTKLTHLIFADDLILFVKGTIKSIYRMMEAINHFSGQPGQITHIFSSDRRGFEKGNLGYYWIFSWLITYEVINAVLFSVYNFWGAVFILLQTVSKAIDRKCRDYLWGSTEEHRKMSLVAWKKVRQPKKFGGLNIKGCKQWNVASIGDTACCLCGMDVLEMHIHLFAECQWITNLRADLVTWSGISIPTKNVSKTYNR
ncbi:uncharacterized protein LOC107819178 [Nicotiana tabacum]|uniref:Uncharacterized protein LOC107819178 n=1 Tax=Nicotiana tabacum TaxID=4097 RepID=A0AC58S4Y3_TOBAC